MTQKAHKIHSCVLNGGKCPVKWTDGMKHKPLVIEKYPDAVCVRVDLGGAYVFRVYSDIFGKGKELSEADAPQIAWARAWEKIQ